MHGPLTLSYLPADTSRPALDLTIGDVGRLLVAAPIRRPAGMRSPVMGSRMSAGHCRGCGDERRLWPTPVPYGYAALPWASVATSAHSSQVFSRSA